MECDDVMSSRLKSVPLSMATQHYVLFCPKLSIMRPDSDSLGLRHYGIVKRNLMIVIEKLILGHFDGARARV